MRTLSEAERGVMVLLHRPETGNDLMARLTTQPKPATKFDLRNYGIGAQILRDLGVGKMKLMAHPRRMPSMAGFGLEVTGYLEQGS
jgi:3,4-dihydroxy 2-butanone 4-phosphate synthase/GTP cyclohydrolase II